MKKIFTLIALGCVAMTLIRAQSTANYAFATTTNGSLVDASGTAVDMSTGTTSLVVASSDNGSSTVQTLAFTFTFMGTSYTQFSASANGVIGLGGTAVSGSLYATPSGSNVLIAPFQGDLKTGTDGKVHTKTFGTAPNRVLVVEFLNEMIVYSSTNAAGTGTFQARLYEGTNVIEFVYGAMARNASTSGSNSNLICVGFATNTTNNTFATVTTSTHAVNTTGTAATNTYTVSTAITDLNSAADGSRRTYKFTPATTTPAAPTALTFPQVTSTGVYLSWTASTSPNAFYEVFNSTDGITYTSLGLTSNTNFTKTGLIANTNYFWRVRSRVEGSTTGGDLDGTQATPTASTPTTYSWNNAAGGSFATATNWTPNRNLTDPTDVLAFNNGGTYTVTGLTSQTVRQMSISTNTNVSFDNSATSFLTLTIAGDGTPSTDDFYIANGSSLSLIGTQGVTITHASSAGNKALIAGTLTMGGPGLTATHSFTTSNNTAVVTTVDGTINFYAGGSTLSGSAASLSFSSGSNFNNYFGASSGGSIPTATWNTTSNITIQNASGITSTATSVSGIAGSFGNFTWNTTSQGNLGMSTTSGTVFNSFTMAGSGASTTRFSASTISLTIGTLSVTGGNLVGQSSSGITTINCTNYTQTSGAGTFDFANASGGNTVLKVSGSFNRTVGTLTRSTAPSSYTSSANGSYIEFNGTSAQTPTIGTLTGVIGLGINNAAGVTATPALNDGANMYVTQGAFSGTATYANTTNKNGIFYQGTSAQVAGTELPSTIGRLTINNTSGVTINANVSLNDASSPLNLTLGIITLGSNNVITLTSGAATLPAGSTTSFVNIAASGSALEITTTSTLSRAWAVGVGNTSNDFRRVSFTSLNQNGTLKIQLASNSSGTAGTGILTLSKPRAYQLTSTGTFTSFGSISLSYGSDDNLGGYTATNLKVVQSTTAGGTYNSIGPVTGTSSPLISTSGTYTTLGFFAFGANELETPVFNAITNNNWSTASNWSTNSVPTCSQVVSIGSGKTCDVDVNNAVAKAITVTGTLNITSASVLTISDCSNNNNNTFTNNGTLNVSGGTLNINGKFIINSGTFTQSGGFINVDGTGTTSVTGDIVSFVTGTYNLSAGTLTIVDPGATTSQNAFNYGGSTNVVCTGTHTVVFGNGSSTQSGSTDGFILSNNNARFNFKNLTINGTALGTNRFVKQAANSNSVLGTMTINTNSEYRQSTYSLHLAGDLINNGTLQSDGSTGDGLNLQDFSTGSAALATGSQTISGSGIFKNATVSTASFTLLKVNNSNATGVTLNTTNPLSTSTGVTLLSGRVTLAQGDLTAGGTLTVTTPSNLNCFITTSGALVMTPVSATARVYPVSAISGSYDPATITPTTSATFGVKVKNSITNTVSTNDPAKVVQREWDIARTGTSGNVTLVLKPDAAALTVGNTPSGAVGVVGHYNGSSWDTNIAAAYATATGWTVTGYAGSFSPFIVSAQGAVLAVEFTNISAAAKGNLNVINFTTATEKDVKEFLIERSINNKTWEVIGTKAAIGGTTTTNYSFNDVNPTTLSYYRVRSVETSGKDHISKIVAVKRNGGKLAVNMVSPVPTTEGVNVDFSTSKIGTLNVVIMDIVGKIVKTETFKTVEGANMMRLNLSNLAQGSYILSLNDGETIATQRIVKQ